MSSICSAASKVGRYLDQGANFIWGTGSVTVGKKIEQAVRIRKVTGDSFIKAVGKGLSQGIKKDSAQLAKTGYFKSIINTFKNLPKEMGTGFKAGKGLGKIGKFIKPLGKLVPIAMSAMWIAGSIPNIVERSKDEGILGGLKETGKTILKMGAFALGSALGTAFGGFGGLFGGMALSALADKMLGEDYKDKKERLAKEAQEQQAQMQNQATGNMTNPFEGFTTVV